MKQIQWNKGNKAKQGRLFFWLLFFGEAKKSNSPSAKTELVIPNKIEPIKNHKQT
ncbi:hypothetical protein ANH9381_0169 [Aggregatibacter actinomycetemcomitans ANH9381]|nr:hypothetical protein ANH9381_0169 [Aggregatibacter actinomycetemcomitans ANH9381]